MAGGATGPDPRYLFVYGTLRRAFHNQYAQYLAANATWMGLARVAGKLYDLGRYPGLQRSTTPGEWVTGELYRLPELPDLLPTLDAYEGSDFERVLAVAQRADRRRVKAWVYEYCPRVSEAWRVASGDYELR